MPTAANPAPPSFLVGLPSARHQRVRSVHSATTKRQRDWLVAMVLPAQTIRPYNLRRQSRVLACYRVFVVNAIPPTSPVASSTCNRRLEGAANVHRTIHFFVRALKSSVSQGVVTSDKSIPLSDARSSNVVRINCSALAAASPLVRKRCSVRSEVAAALPCHGCHSITLAAIVVPRTKVAARPAHLLIRSHTRRHRGCPNTTPRSRPVGRLCFTVPVRLAVLVRGRHSCPSTHQGNLNLMVVPSLSPRELFLMLRPCRRRVNRYLVNSL